MALYHRLVSLPLYPAMSQQQVLYVAESVKEIVRATRKVRLVAVPAKWRGTSARGTERRTRH
jgi:hypothetical protein